MNNAKIILYLLIALIPLGLGAYLINRLQQPLAKDKPSPTKPIRNLLFVGDSLTAHKNSYADTIKDNVPGLIIKKIASVGKQTGWMKDELQKELSNNQNYDAVVIWGGVNDIYATNSVNKAKQNIQDMIKLAESIGAMPVLVTVIPTNTYPSSTAKTEQLTKELNDWIKSKSTLVVDANKLINNGAGGTRKDYLAADKLHLTDNAHATIGYDLYKKIIA